MKRRRKTTAQPRPKAPPVPREPTEYEKLGPPPLTDALAGVDWMQRHLLLAAHEAATDPSISPKERREALLKLGRAIGALVPQERLYQAERRIRRDAGSMGEIRDSPQTVRTDASNAQGSLRVDTPRRRGG